MYSFFTVAFAAGNTTALLLFLSLLAVRSPINSTGIPLTLEDCVLTPVVGWVVGVLLSSFLLVFLIPVYRNVSSRASLVLFLIVGFIPGMLLVIMAVYLGSLGIFPETGKFATEFAKNGLDIAQLIDLAGTLIYSVFGSVIAFVAWRKLRKIEPSNLN